MTIARQAPAAAPDVSVIIAHLNQPDLLQKCLHSLAIQDFASPGIEIIVVDNGSREMPTTIVAQFANARLEHEPVAGPGPARNTGVAKSKGEIIAFIDSDCIADPDWVRTLVTVLRDGSGRRIIGGNVRVANSIAGKPTMVEAYEQVFSFRQRHYIEAQNFSATLNMATWRDVFEQVGPFGGIEIAEDRDWGHRATRMGLKTHFVENMWVTHPARHNMQEIAAKFDRLLSHDYAGLVPGWRSQVKWFLKTLAVACSPALSFAMIIRSSQLRRWRDRALAICGLVLVRLYRAGKMLALQFGTRRGKDGHAWNRKP